MSANIKKKRSYSPPKIVENLNVIGEAVETAPGPAPAPLAPIPSPIAPSPVIAPVTPAPSY